MRNHGISDATTGPAMRAPVLDRSTAEADCAAAAEAWTTVVASFSVMLAEPKSPSAGTRPDPVPGITLEATTAADTAWSSPFTADMVVASVFQLMLSTPVLKSGLVEA
jgi:hypothetical protein